MSAARLPPGGTEWRGVLGAQRSRPAAVFLAALALYLATRPSAGYNSDVYELIAEIRSGEPDRLFHEHHLIYNATGRIWLRLWEALGVPARDDMLLRGLSALLGALTVLGFYRLSGHWTARARDRLLASACFATCFGIWMFSVDVEVYVASTLFLIFALDALWRAGPELSLRAAAGAGLLLGIGTLYHQMGVLFTPVALAVIATGPAPPRRRLAAAVVCLGTGGLVTLIPYVAAGVVYHGVRSPEDFLVWVLGYSLRGYGEGLHPPALIMAVVGHGRTLIFFGHVLRALQAPDHGLAAAGGLALVAAAALVFAVGAWGALLGWRRAAAQRDLRAIWRPLAVWFLIYAVFTLWWEPENPEFWVTAMAPFFALWTGGLALAGGRWSWLPVAVLAIAIPSNLTDLMARRDPGHDPEVRALRVIADRVSGDTVIMPSSLTSRAKFFTPGLRWINLYHVLKWAPSEEAALADLTRRIAEERAAGRRVYLYGEPISSRMRSIFPHAEETLEELMRRQPPQPRFEVVLPHDPADSFGTLARPRPIPVYELLPPEPQAAAGPEEPGA